jgi:hypothetical protein
MALQIPVIANQASVSADDMAAVTTFTLFMENCGETLFVASSEGAFTNGLLSSLSNSLPDIDPKTILDVGATQIRTLYSGQELEKVLGGYLDACKTGHHYSCLWCDCRLDFVIERGSCRGDVVET